jgi:glyoxylase-like metal-dependent hydrolase (beta-lactamase superfamily II)
MTIFAPVQSLLGGAPIGFSVVFFLGLLARPTAMRIYRARTSAEPSQIEVNQHFPLDIFGYPIDLSIEPEVTGFFDPETNTISYVAKEPKSRSCAIIDTVTDIDYAAGRIRFVSADRIIAFVKDHHLKVEWLIEMHAHADHLSAAPYLQQKLGGNLVSGERIKIVQEVFGKIFNQGKEFRRDAPQFDELFKDGDRYTIGGMKAFAMHTPATHPPA